jgi:hypothetical protein
LAQVRFKVETAGAAEANIKLQKALPELAESRSDNQKQQLLIDESQVESQNVLLFHCWGMMLH